VFTRSLLAVRFMPDTRVVYRARVDEDRKQLVFPMRGEIWAYRFANAEHVVLDGTRSGHRYHIELARAAEPLLETRGFHWIQEAPFHR